MLHTTQGIAGLFLVSHGWVVNVGKVRAAAGGSTTHGAPAPAGGVVTVKTCISRAAGDAWFGSLRQDEVIAQVVSAGPQDPSQSTGGMMHSFRVANSGSVAVALTSQLPQPRLGPELQQVRAAA